MSIQQTIERIRSFTASQGWKKGRLAREAGLQKTTLRNFNEPDWNPTRETIEKLERVIPEGWTPPAQPNPENDNPTEAAA